MKHSNGLYSRRRRSPEERARLIREYRSTELTQEAFAKRYGISVATLCRWLRQEEEHSCGGVEQREPWIEVPVEAAAAFPEPEWDYLVETRAGLRLHFRRGFDREELVRLIPMLGGAACSR